MKKYQIIFILLLVFFYLMQNYIGLESFRKDKQVFLSDLNMSIIDMHKQVLVTEEQLSATTFLLWGMEESLILKNRRATELKANEQNNSNTKSDLKNKVKLKQRVICLEKKCWEFLGIISTSKDTVVTLLSTEANSKLETFHVNDMLLEDLMIVQIKGDQLVLEDRKEKKIFILKLFDVDVIKYTPKKIKKENNESKI